MKQKRSALERTAAESKLQARPGEQRTRMDRKEKMMEKTIPYKIYLEEQEMPKQWYNVRADMKKKPAPILNPGTLEPVTLEELSKIFCTELARQELDDVTPFFDIPEEIRSFYKMYCPSPLVRA